MTDRPQEPSAPNRPQAPPPPPVPALPLDYGLRAQSRAGSWVAFFARIVAGFIGFIILSLGWARFGVALHLTGGIIFLGWLGMTAALLAAAYYVRTRFNRPGYGYGILLVFVALGGIILLILGLCFSNAGRF